jgi:endonuclease/exonuclease/phosphatase family metal-dependent hydrolase
MLVRVLTWNLFHGRAVPASDVDLLDAFAAQLADWTWDVALLQEVPPWWPAELARAAGAQERHALTSRNAGLPLRRALAQRHPELIKSNGGGCNAILVRSAGGIAAHASLRLRVWPERRVVHAVRDGEGQWFANLHASVHNDARARADIERARVAALRWADEAAALAQAGTELARATAPLVLGGDLNLRDPHLPGFVHVGPAHGVDHVFARGLAPAAPAELLDRGTLSDHAPVRVTLGTSAPAAG